MPRSLVIANWKMHTTVPKAVKLASEVRDALNSSSDVDVVLCPPFVSLVSVKEVLEGSPIGLGAQNMYPEAEGAFTGEVSYSMLADLCDFVVVGHSERRRIFGESDEFICGKVRAAFAVGLRPILCVGETLEKRESGQAEEVVRSQLAACLAGTERCDGLAVAYEPVWAIGTGVPASPDTAQEMMGGVILGTLDALYGEHAAFDVPLLYGGSVTPDNWADFIGQPSIHGALVGGASLQASQFIEIIRITARVKGD